MTTDYLGVVLDALSRRRGRAGRSRSASSSTSRSATSSASRPSARSASRAGRRRPRRCSWRSSCSGMVAVFDFGRLTDPVDLGHVADVGRASSSRCGWRPSRSPAWSRRPGLAGEVAVGAPRPQAPGRPASRDACWSSTSASRSSRSARCRSSTGRPRSARDWLEAPLLGVVAGVRPAVAGRRHEVRRRRVAAVTLVAAANSAMLGLSRLAYSLATNRQIPSPVGRLHPTRATPYVRHRDRRAARRRRWRCAGPRLPGRHLRVRRAARRSRSRTPSIIALRYKEPDRPRPVPRCRSTSTFRGGSLPLPAVLGAVARALAWLSVLVPHEGARYVGLGWMAFGLPLYVIYRTQRGQAAASSA